MEVKKMNKIILNNITQKLLFAVILLLSKSGVKESLQITDKAIALLAIDILHIILQGKRRKILILTNLHCKFLCRWSPHKTQTAWKASKLSTMLDQKRRKTDEANMGKTISGRGIMRSQKLFWTSYQNFWLIVFHIK